MTSLHYIWDIFLASLRRILARKVTTFSAIFSLTLAISLLMGISIYTDGIYYQSFLDNIAETRENPESQVTIDNPTFSFLFHYYSGWHGGKTWDELSRLDSYFTQQGVQTLNIPSVDVVRLFETNTFYLFPQDNTTDVNSLYLSRTSFGVMSNLEKQATLVAGRFPDNQTEYENEPIEILVNQSLASRAGLRLNQDFLAYFKIVSAAGNRETIHLPVRIVGIWKPTDPTDDYWIFAPSYYENILFTNERTFFTRLGSNFPQFVNSSYWYLIMDANYVHSDEIGGLLRRIDRMERGANELLPDLWLSISPRNALEDYAEDARTLRVLLYAFTIPIIGIIFAFINLVSLLSIQQRRNEIAVIRSRGGTKTQVLGLTTIDNLILSMISFSISISISMQIARLISQTVSFSEFATASKMRSSITSGTIQIGIFVVVVYLVMLLLPVSRALQATIITYRTTISRFTQKPLWQRAWLDLLLFIPAAYGAYLLQSQGSLAPLGSDGLTNDPFRNPILFLVPSLGILSLSLFSLRLVQFVMVILDSLIAWAPWAGLTIAIRQIARRPVNYHTPLLILTLSVSLFVYTAALARTFDQHLTAQEYYRIGADVHFFDPGDPTISGDPYKWDFFPVDEYTLIDGIQSAARLGRYSVQIKTARIQSKGIFIGIDRLSFPKVAYWREDFADQSLGTLLNVLAENPTNVLVNSDFVRLSGLQIGDTIQGTVKTYNQDNDLDFRIAGEFTYFPTWYPEQGPLLVGNLDNLFYEASSVFPYYVLLKTDPGIDPRTIGSVGIRAMDQRIRPVDWKTPTQLINQAQNTPERQGLLGILFVGSITTILLTVLAFFLHLVFSYQGRLVEFSILRAGGLSIFQMTSILVWELSFLIIFGGAVGTILGLISGQSFIPYFQVGDGSNNAIPPFQVLVPWEMIVNYYWLFCLLFVVSLLVSILLLRQSKIFEAIKLGESI